MSTRFYRCEMSRAVAQHVVRKLLELRIPLQTEYLRNGLIVVVPGTYAATLTQLKDEAQRAVDTNTIPGCYN